MNFWGITVHILQWARKKTRCSQVAFWGRGFGTKALAKCGGIVWWNGEQDKKSYNKGSKNPAYLPNLVGEHYHASGLV